MASEKIVKQIYNGLFTIVHDPFARGSAPRYKVNDTKPKGVTTILGNTLNKDLTGWAVDACVDYLRTKLPSITEDDLQEGANQYKYKRDSGASTGTEAHALVEDFLRGKKPDKQAVHTQEAINAYNAFVKWFIEAEAEVINVEEVIYSQKHEYAGTYDCMLRIDGKVYLCDLKTTNSSRKAPRGVYAEMYAQLGAYSLAHEEQRLYEAETGGTDLEKIDGLMVISAKKDGKLDIVTNDDLALSVQECQDVFVNVLQVFKYLKDTTAKLGGK